MTDVKSKYKYPTNQKLRGQRPTKPEREAVQKVLRGFWRKAFEEGEFIQEYPSNIADSKEKASVLYNALAECRKKVRKNKLKDFEMDLIVSGCTLQRVDDYTVRLFKKRTKFASRTSIILDVAKQLPELQINEPKTNLDEIMKDFKT